VADVSSGKNASELDAARRAFLRASSIPGTYNPGANPGNAESRRQYVVGRMRPWVLSPPSMPPLVRNQQPEAHPPPVPNTSPTIPLVR